MKYYNIEIKTLTGSILNIQKKIGVGEDFEHIEDFVISIIAGGVFNFEEDAGFALSPNSILQLTYNTMSKQEVNAFTTFRVGSN